MEAGRKSLLSFALLVWIAVPSSDCVEFFVATTGDDSSNGTSTSPFRTITRAQKEVRNWLSSPSSPSNENAVVNIAEGEYRIHSALTFNGSDSGSSSRTVCIHSFFFFLLLSCLMCFLFAGDLQRNKFSETFSERKCFIKWKLDSEHN